MRKRPANVLLIALILSAPALQSPRSMAAPAQETSSGAAKPASFLGTVQSIDGQTLTVKNDAGASLQVSVQESARMLRVEPGQKDLQSAQPLSLTDLQVGDRVLARGSASSDGKQLTATTLIAIKKSDIAQKQEQDREAWQKNGVGGLVQSVDPAAGTVTISLTGKRTLTIQTSRDTVFRRYAPGSVEFDQAKPATLAETKPGDQLRARGSRSADGQSFAAQEIVSGSFRNIAGTVVTANPGASTLTVTDLVTKRPVVVQVTPATQLKKLDAAVAQRIALRLKGGVPPAGAAPGGAESGARARAGAGPEVNPAGRSALDPQQILARSPSVTLKDFAKGDAVMLVATEGTAPGPVTAVTVVGGVEPMFQASTSGSQAMLSSAWNLSGGGEDAASQ